MATQDGENDVSDMAIAYERHRVGIDEYHRMVEAGVFEPDARVELISGELLEEMSPPKPPHSTSTTILINALIGRLGSLATVRCQDPVTLPDDSEPQPDVSIAVGAPKDYWARHPGPDDIMLLVEVSYASRDFDRTVKVPLYARARISELWLVDLVDDIITVYREPREGLYSSVRIAKRGEDLSILAFPEQRFAVNDFLPPV